MLRSTIHVGTVLMSIVPAAADYYRQRNTCCSGFDDSRLISDNEKHQRLSNPAQTKEKVYLDRKPLRRALKKYNKDADIQLFIAVGFWRGKGRAQLCSRGRWKFDYTPMKIWAIQIVLDVFGE